MWGGCGWVWVGARGGGAVLGPADERFSAANEVTLKLIRKIESSLTFCANSNAMSEPAEGKAGGKTEEVGCRLYIRVVETRRRV